MTTALVFDPALGAYDLAPWHPLRPERVLLAVELIEAYDMLDGGAMRALAPRSATREELERVHDAAYVDTVIDASSSRTLWLPKRGIGPGDTPQFPAMHAASSLIAGASLTALASVLDGGFARAFSPAGGLHHAHRDRAAGFCVYNDAAVAIAAALADHPDLRVLYVDIDAHHGDGVQEAFYDEPRVLTISLHESGAYLYPGTGFTNERGAGAGAGSAINVPLPRMATDECYALAFERVVAPAARRFMPDLVVAQCGADAHWTDPLTDLGLTLGGYRSLVVGIVGLAEELCAGRLVALGGGGYAWATVVPRAWTLVAAALCDLELPDTIPQAWQDRVRALGPEPPASLYEDPGPALDAATRAAIIAETERVLHEVIERL